MTISTSWLKVGRSCRISLTVSGEASVFWKFGTLSSRCHNQVRQQCIHSTTLLLCFPFFLVSPFFSLGFVYCSIRPPTRGRDEELSSSLIFAISFFFFFPCDDDFPLFYCPIALWIGGFSLREGATAWLRGDANILVTQAREGGSTLIIDHSSGGFTNSVSLSSVLFIC